MNRPQFIVDGKPYNEKSWIKRKALYLAGILYKLLFITKLSGQLIKTEWRDCKLCFWRIYVFSDLAQYFIWLLNWIVLCLFFRCWDKKNEDSLFWNYSEVNYYGWKNGAQPIKKVFEENGYIDVKSFILWGNSNIMWRTFVLFTIKTVTHISVEERRPFLDPVRTLDRFLGFRP